MSPTHLSHTKAVPFFAACFPVICVAYGSGYNYSSILLLASCIVSLIFAYKEIKLSTNEKLFIYALLYYFLTFLLLKFFHGEKWSFIDKPSRALLTIPIFIALLLNPPSWKSISIGINIASICSAIVALFYFEQYPELRAFDGRIPNVWFDGYMQIQTGGIVTTFAISSLAIALIELKNKNFLYSMFSLIAFFFASWASLQSGSRGSWLLVPLASLLIIHRCFNFFRLKVLFCTLIAIALTLSAVSLNERIVSRVNLAISDYQQFSSNTNDNTSVGIRLNLWKSAVITFSDNPTFGAGLKGRIEQRRALGDNGVIDKKVSRKTYHEHNQFLEAASVGGFAWLSALLTILIVPLFLFYQSIKCSYSDEVKNFSLLGIINIILITGYCLTQAFFNHNSGTIFYLVWTTILLSASLASSKKGYNNESTK
ncbi:O-antigen ligase family protein [Vibrio splendidus]|uniref:O-antigen ligase family protein n=1 Tax=Vibrio splendidus TaxID=29497 RepID=UPI000D3864E6|nr:O-antigen ligase family protein [Vibrio splendidus]PTP29421.1 hypothetical protein CWN92_11955 [Vibrio splendidus]RIH70330.1 hypothetical protein BJG01_08130 [Vibrio splendidus]URM14387.1 O-antigen ligase family protein [Vibrio splendidus]